MFQGCGHSLAHWMYNRCDSAGTKLTQQCGHHQKSIYSHMGNVNHSLAATPLCVLNSLSFSTVLLLEQTAYETNFQNSAHTFTLSGYEWSLCWHPWKTIFWGGGHFQSLQFSASAFLIHFCNKQPLGILGKIYNLENHSLFQMLGSYWSSFSI